MVTETKELTTVEQIQRELPTLAERARAMAQITDQPSFEKAGRFLVQIKDFRKKVEKAFGPVAKKAHETWKEAVALRKKVDDPLDGAEQEIKRAMGVYYAEQEHIRKEDEAWIQAEMTKREEDARLGQAAELEKAGEGAAAQAVLDAPVVAMPITLPKAQADGISMKINWRVKVTNLRALVKAVAEGRADLGLIQANMMALNGMARALKGTMTIPGVRAVSEMSVAARAA
jgi:hypothetical protein